MSIYDESKHQRGGNPDNIGQYSRKGYADDRDLELATPSSLEGALIERGGSLDLTAGLLRWDDLTFVKGLHAERANDGATTVTVVYDVGAPTAVERAGLTDKGRGAAYVAAHRNTISRLLQSLYGLEKAPQEGFEAYAHTTVFPTGMSLDKDLDWMLENRVRPLNDEMSKPAASLGERLAFRCESVDDANVEAGTMYAVAEAERAGCETPTDAAMAHATRLSAKFYERAGEVLDRLPLSASDWGLALYRCRKSGYNGFSEYSVITDAEAKRLCQVARSF